MKITTGQSSGRAAYYDRNPLQVSQNYNAIIGPAGTTTRWVYTVPAARKAFIEGTMVMTQRATAAAPVGNFNGLVQYSIAGVGYNPINIVGSQDNVVGQAERLATGAGGMMSATDTLKGITGDAGTGGTVYYDITAKLVEFDA